MITQADPVLRYVIESVRAHPWISRLFIFGSRARGDHRQESDYDLAFELKSSDPRASDWARFSVELVEKSPTLHKLDLVVLGQCGPALEERIQRERVLLYENKKK